MQEYDILKELGSGSFGRVLKVRRKQDSQVLALKTVKMKQLNAKEKDNALNEIRLLASMDSPNVIKYKGAFFQQNGYVLSIVMEFADGGDLAGLVDKKMKKNEPFDENFIWKVSLDILKGLKFLHANNIIHRDIKPANIFFVNGIAKLGDMNVSKVIEGKYASTQTGTPYYTSPEIWQGKKYTATCDIWSLGCVIYQLCTLRPPFTAKDFPGLMRKVVSGYYDPISSKYSKKLSSFVRKCLTVDSYRRPTANELLQGQVFQLMDTTDEGQMDLLDTIRCPRVLRLINQQLPSDQYASKKPKTLKFIADETPKRNGSSGKNAGSMKRIGSEKCIRDSSIDRNENRPAKYMNNVVQSPNGYVKLPKIASNKFLH